MTFFLPCLPALGDTLLSVYLPCELKMGGSAQSYCFFTLETGVVSVYTWSFLLEYFQSYPDPEGGLFVREESLLRLWCLKTCSAFFLHSDSIHWHWSVQRTHASHRLSLMVSNRAMSCRRVRWYLNFLICFPVKKWQFFIVFFYLGVDMC